MAAKVFLSYRRDASAGHAGRVKDRLDRMPVAMGVRRQTVEHPFGTLKAWMGATHFLTRTLDKVRTEMSLHVLAHNLKRMIKIFGADLIGFHTRFGDVAELLAERDASDIVLFGGGIIPEADVHDLEGAGVAKVFGPGTRTDEIVDWVRANVGTAA